MASAAGSLDPRARLGEKSAARRGVPALTVVPTLPTRMHAKVAVQVMPGRGGMGPGPPVGLRRPDPDLFRPPS